MASHLLTLECAGINQHTSVNLVLSSLAFLTRYENDMTHKKRYLAGGYLES